MGPYRNGHTPPTTGERRAPIIEVKVGRRVYTPVHIGKGILLSAAVITVLVGAYTWTLTLMGRRVIDTKAATIDSIRVESKNASKQSEENFIEIKKSHAITVERVDSLTAGFNRVTQALERQNYFICRMMTLSYGDNVLPPECTEVEARIKQERKVRRDD